MNASIPIYIERRKGRESMTPVYAVRPLFFPAMEYTDEQLSQALNRLAREVRRHLYSLSQAPRHDDLVPWTYCPEIESRRLTLRFPLRRRTAECRLLFVAFEQFDRRVAFSPGFPDLWLDIQRGQRLADRATERSLARSSVNGRKRVPMSSSSLSERRSKVRRGSSSLTSISPR